jgi:predicted nucleic acid-binding protein
MNLDDIRNGARVFIDANIILYGIRRSSRQCHALLSRCADGAVDAFISTAVLAEVNHRRMVEEAKAKGLVSSNPARALSERPELVRQLGAYAQDMRDILGGGLSIECLLPEDFHVGLEFQRQFGLLTIDSLNLAVARRLNITDLATADRGFDPVQGFIVYKPVDISGL